MAVTACRSASCRAPIVWMLTVAGKKMPIDRDPVPDGDFYINDDDRLARILPGMSLGLAHVDRYTSHFVTCPDADAWRKPR